MWVMTNNMKQLIIMVVFYFCFANTFVIAAKLNIDSEKKLINLYTNDMKSQLDMAANPCNNFAQYACGNLRNRDRVGYRYREKDSFFIEDNLLKDGPKTEAEQQAKDFYLSCRDEGEIKKIFEQVDTLKEIFYDGGLQWPTKENFTKQEIAELMAELAAIAEMEMIKIHIRDNQIFLEGTQPRGIERFENITKIMEEFGTSSEEANIAAKEIIELIQKLENLFRYFSPETITDVRFQNRGILQRKIPNFDWNTYLTKYFSDLNLKIDQFNYDIRTKNIELLETVVNFIEKQDRRIIANYLVWRFIQFGMKHNCEEFLPYFRPAVWLRLWNKYMDHDDELRHIELLNNFEKSYNEIKDLRLTSPSLSILGRVTNRRNIVTNHTQILNDEVIKKHYDTFQVSPSTLYKNQINFYHTIVRDCILYGDKGRFSELHNAFLSGLGGEIDIFAHDRPMLYYFVSENLELWRKAFTENKPWNSTILQKCASKDINDNEIIEFSANKQNYENFLEYFNINGKDDELGSIEDKIEMKKLYFIALAQYQCFDSGRYKLHDSGIFKFLQYFSDFSKEFKCKKIDKMNLFASGCYFW